MKKTKQEETVLEPETTKKPIESVTLTIDQTKPEEPLVHVLLKAQDELLFEAKMPAQLFNTPAGYGHAIEITINAYANGKEINSPSIQESEGELRVSDSTDDRPPLTVVKDNDN